MPPFILTSLSKSRQNLEIVEIRQVHRVIYFSSRTGRKVFLGDDISYLWCLLFNCVSLVEIGRFTFSKIRFEIGRSPRAWLSCVMEVSLKSHR